MTVIIRINCVNVVLLLNATWYRLIDILYITINYDVLYNVINTLFIIQLHGLLKASFKIKSHFLLHQGSSSISNMYV